MVITPNKKFVQLDYQFPDLNRIDGEIRRYETPSGQKYPSMTTVLSRLSEGELDGWRNFVGEEKADAIASNASHRGTGMHDIAENYVLGYDKNDISEFPPISHTLFGKIKPFINDNYTHIVGTETMLYSHELKLAGTTDLVAYTDYENRVLSTADYKNSRNDLIMDKPYKKKKLFLYLMQGVGYSVMLEEMESTLVSKYVDVLVANLKSKGVFYRFEIQPWMIREFKNIVKSYYGEFPKDKLIASKFL